MLAVYLSDNNATDARSSEGRKQQTPKNKNFKKNRLGKTEKSV